MNNSNTFESLTVNIYALGQFRTKTKCCKANCNESINCTINRSDTASIAFTAHINKTVYGGDCVADTDRQSSREGKRPNKARRNEIEDKAGSKGRLADGR